MHENQISSGIISASIAIHRTLGPGLLESVYEKILAHELSKGGFIVEVQKTIPLIYGDLCIEDAFRADLVVNNQVLVELKSVRTLEPVHHKQVLTYLRLTGLKLGLLINFNAHLLKDGVARVINGGLN